MEFLFDTTNLADIEQFGSCFPYTGVTSNPTILKNDGQVEFFETFRKIRELIGTERTLHVQVVAADREGMVAEARTILDRIDSAVYIKIPATEEGLAAMLTLKSEGVNVTATAVYTKMQGIMSVAVGADYIAPYVNRVAALDGDPYDLIATIAQAIDARSASTRIVAASFKNAAQVTDALIAGAHTVTVPPRLLHEAFGAAAIGKAVTDFGADWAASFGARSITQL